MLEESKYLGYYKNISVWNALAFPASPQLSFLWSPNNTKHLLTVICLDWELFHDMIIWNAKKQLQFEFQQLPLNQDIQNHAIVSYGRQYG